MKLSSSGPNLTRVKSEPVVGPVTKTPKVPTVLESPGKWKSTLLIVPIPMMIPLGLDATNLCIWCSL